jgi:cytidyltransferase-like protein
MKEIVLVTGGFDPIHSGHIDYFKSAKQISEYLIVGLNSDEWLMRKKGKYFMNFSERAAIVDSIRYVDAVINFDDSDGSAKNAILKVLELYPDSSIVFANGGDRNSKNIPEMDISHPRLSFVFGTGGDFKKNSSSWILEQWKSK